MNFRVAIPNDLDEIIGLYRACIGIHGCTWDEGYPNREICIRDIEEGRLFVMEERVIVSAISYECSDAINAMDVWQLKKGPIVKIRVLQEG